MNKVKPDSTRSIGQASIGTDKPTRDRLKALADAAGMHVSDYLRYLVNNIDEQGRLVPDSPSVDATLPAMSVNIAKVSGQVQEVQTALNCLAETIAIMLYLPAEIKAGTHGEIIKAKTQVIEGLLKALPDGIKTKVQDIKNSAIQSVFKVSNGEGVDEARA